MINSAIDHLLTPTTLFFTALLGLLLLYAGRRTFVRPAAASLILLGALLSLGLLFSDSHLAAAAFAADNIPVLVLILLLGFFTWLAAFQGVQNDARMDNRNISTRPALEKEDSRKTFTWPDLVYSELICATIVMTILLAWSLLVPAPLEQPAHPALTPNPAKAPWYFLGLQELLFHCDGWMAGLTIPCLMVLGLMAIPYLDVNPRGSGYYTIDERPFAYVVFQFGFWLLWILPIVIGTFFRGPNWAFYGPFAPRDAQPLTAAVHTSLANPPGNTFWLAYFIGLPLSLSLTVLRGVRRRMGLPRFLVFLSALLAMLAIPLRILFR